MPEHLASCEWLIELLIRGKKVRELVEIRSRNLQQEYDLNTTDLQMIMYLSQCGSHDTLGEMAAFLHANKGYMSQKMSGLVARGLVKVRDDEQDRRYIHYSLTETAEPIAARFLEVLQDLGRAIGAGISQEEVEIFRGVVNKSLQNAIDLLAREQ